MSVLSRISIEALLDRAEHPGLIAAAEQLSECLGQAVADDHRWPVHLELRPPGAKIEASSRPAVVIASLLPDVVFAEEPIAKTEARWRPYLRQLQEPGAPVCIRTVFRHVSDRDRTGVTSPLLERIRRLNRMAVALSHELGVMVIDIDRAFADIGARRLKTDYRLGGPLAAEVSGHTMAWALLSIGLDDIVAPDVQEKAKTILGNLQSIGALLDRRLRRHQAGRAAQQSTAPG